MNKYQCERCGGTGAEPEGKPSDLIRDGAQSITDERKRQIEVEGWTATRDDEYRGGEMAAAAACYAWIAGTSDEDRAFYVPFEQPAEGWPWGDEWWKPKDRRADLVRAGALIAAEIDRLDRLAAGQSNYLREVE